MTDQHEPEEPQPAQGTSPPTQPAPPPGYGPPGYGPSAYLPPPTHASTGFPVWAIVLIIVAILAIPAGIVAAVAIPMFLSQHDKANDSSVKEGIHRLQVGIQSYAVDNGDIYPQPEDVTPEGAVGRYVDRWPTNPWSGEPMRPGAQPGDYRYTVIDEGFDATGFSLEGYLHDGEPFVVP